MAYFAQINDSGIVEKVISINNSVIGEPDNSFPTTESAGVDFITNTLRIDGTWKQTSYNKSFRKNYAGIGFSYDPIRDAFVPPQPFPSWLLNEQTCLWEAPVPKPEGNWYWDETTTSWKEIANDPL